MGHLLTDAIKPIGEKFNILIYGIDEICFILHNHNKKVHFLPIQCPLKHFFCSFPHVSPCGSKMK